MAFKIKNKLSKKNVNNSNGKSCHVQCQILPKKKKKANKTVEILL